jgi:hypothetical protein
MMKSNKAFFGYALDWKPCAYLFLKQVAREGCMMQTPPGLAFTLASKQALRVSIQATRKFYQFCTNLWESVGDLICYKALV